MTRVYVIRHGENYANVIKQLSSRIVDYSITEKGKLQAHQTGEALVGRVSKLFSAHP